jgi:hypothetical protein
MAAHITLGGAAFGFAGSTSIANSRPRACTAPFVRRGRQEADGQWSHCAAERPILWQTPLFAAFAQARNRVRHNWLHVPETSRLSGQCAKTVGPIMIAELLRSTVTIDPPSVRRLTTSLDPSHRNRLPDLELGVVPNVEPCETPWDDCGLCTDQHSEPGCRSRGSDS